MDELEVLIRDLPNDVLNQEDLSAALRNIEELRDSRPSSDPLDYDDWIRVQNDFRELDMPLSGDTRAALEFSTNRRRVSAEARRLQKLCLDAAQAGREDKLLAHMYELMDLCDREPVANFNIGPQLWELGWMAELKVWEKLLGQGNRVEAQLHLVRLERILEKLENDVPKAASKSSAQEELKQRRRLLKNAHWAQTAYETCTMTYADYAQVIQQHHEVLNRGSDFFEACRKAGVSVEADNVMKMVRRSLHTHLLQLAAAKGDLMMVIKHTALLLGQSEPILSLESWRIFLGRCARQFLTGFLTEIGVSLIAIVLVKTASLVSGLISPYFVA
jgi:hypothetical protein